VWAQQLDSIRTDAGFEQIGKRTKGRFAISGNRDASASFEDAFPFLQACLHILQKEKR
jgi:hypothetical protein